MVPPAGATSKLGRTTTRWARAFPLVRAGGLFILIMGRGVAAGGVFVRRRRVPLGVGVAVAFIAVTAIARALAAPL